MKKILSCIIIPFVIILVFVCSIYFAFVFPFRSISGDVNYNQAKAQSVRLFENRREKFISAKDDVITQQSTDKISVKGVKSINFEQQEGTSKIKFEIGYQGMLGGQYWGIYYASNDMPMMLDLREPAQFAKGPYSGSYYYKEQYGNNFYATEKIEDGWYFYYMDLDGNKHGLDWN